MCFGQTTLQQLRLNYYKGNDVNNSYYIFFRDSKKMKKLFDYCLVIDLQLME